MRNKKIFSFDEEKDALKVIANGFPTGLIDYSQMYLVAKYFRKAKKYGAIRLERELINFCKQQDKNFNPVTEAEAIKKWIKSATNYELRKIENVSISQKEIDFLKTIEIEKDRKLLFITLVFAKALKKRVIKKGKTAAKPSDNFYIHYDNFLDIIRLSKINNLSEIDLASILYKYRKYVTFYRAQRETIRIDYGDKDTRDGIILSDLENSLNYYDLLFEKNKAISVCKKCGKKIIKSNNKKMYCDTCSALLEKQRKARWKEEHKSITADRGEIEISL